MNAKSKLMVKYAEGVIEINTTFEKMMRNPLSDEYTLLQKIKVENPGFAVRKRQIKTNPNKDTYKGLTYEYMRNYIILHTSGEERVAKIAEFDELILISQCHGQSKRYPTIKKWFLQEYPDVAKFGVVETTPEAQAEQKPAESNNQNVIPMPAATQKEVLEAELDDVG